MIITTSVRFFESLFQTGRRLPPSSTTLGNSVVLFDEAESLPADFHLGYDCGR